MKKWIVLSVFISLALNAFPLRAEEVKLLINQAGYDLNGPKRVWLETDFPPENILSFHLVRGERSLITLKWGDAREISEWGKWYRTGDFSFWSRPGRYRICVSLPGETITSYPFFISSNRLASLTGPLAVRFFYIQRCGCRVEGWHEACHLDDGRMPEGSRRELSGGWHDAGDYNKYNGFTPLSVYALARFAGSRADFCSEDQPEFPTPLEEAQWGAEWIKKCMDPVTKRIIGMVFSGYGFWGPPELETDNVPGTGDDRPVFELGWNENEMAAAALAVLARKSGSSSWTETCREIWNEVLAFSPLDDDLYMGKRLLAAVEVHRLFQDPASASEASACALYLVESQKADGSWDLWPIINLGLIPAALGEFIREFSGSPMADDVRDALALYLQYWSSLRAAPFDVPKWDTENFFYPFIPGEWYAGQNSMYLSLAWAGFLINNILSPCRAGEAGLWASGCLDWVLGANPLGVCMMEGAGIFHLPRYHHRYESIDNGRGGRVPGAVCNGITRSSPGADSPFLDLSGNAWQTNEPWLPHNAYFLLALTEYERNPQKKARRKR